MDLYIQMLNELNRKTQTENCSIQNFNVPFLSINWACNCKSIVMLQDFNEPLPQCMHVCMYACIWDIHLCGCVKYKYISHKCTYRKQHESLCAFVCVTNTNISYKSIYIETNLQQRKGVEEERQESKRLYISQGGHHVYPRLAMNLGSSLSVSISLGLDLQAWHTHLAQQFFFCL